MLVGAPCDDPSHYFGAGHNRERSRTIVKRALLRFLTSIAVFEPTCEAQKVPDTTSAANSQQVAMAADGLSEGEGASVRGAQRSEGGLASFVPQLGADFDHALVVHRSPRTTP
jgi:hypothetical protein